MAGSNSRNSTLMQCYETNGTNGFRLWANGLAKVSWGTGSTDGASFDTRDMLVLRHIKGENSIHIYCANCYGDNINYVEIAKNRLTKTDATLVLGCAKADDGAYENFATGVIYWAKLWYADLGDAACRQLAAWTHEEFEFEACGFKRYYLSNSSKRNITFSNIGNTNTSNKISWSGSADGADIYYQTTASDQGNLVLNLRDDSNCYLRIAKNGSFKSYFSPDDGNFHGNVNGTADNATTSNGVKDYNDANRTIKIGYAGAGLTAGNLSHVAGYTDNGTKIKDVSKDVLKSQIGLGSYAVAGHTHSSINSLGAKNAQTGRNQAYGNVYSYNSNNSAHEGMPTTYASTIGFGQGSAGTVEICGEWTGGKGLWSRALRDYQDNWYNWQRIYTENYHPNADTAKSVAQTGITGKPELYTKAEVNTLMKKAMYSEGKLVGTGRITYSYNSDGTLVVPSTSDYIKIVSVSGHGSYSVPINTKMIIGTTLYTNNSRYYGKIIFDTNGKITCVGFDASNKSDTCTYYIEAYQYY